MVCMFRLKNIISTSVCPLLRIADIHVRLSRMNIETIGIGVPVHPHFGRKSW